MINSFLLWLQEEPLLAILGFSALTFLLTFGAMLVARRRHGERCYESGKASRQPELDRLQADLDNALAEQQELRKQMSHLTDLRVRLTGQLSQYQTEAQRLPALESRLHEAREKLTALSSANAALQTRLEEQQHLNREQKNLLETAQESLKAQFKNLAQKILDEKSQKFTQQNQSNLKATLTPLQNQLAHFQELIRKTHQEDVEKQSVLLKEIENLKQLNLNISEEARNLTRALKADSKTQGNWGELVLERVLESSGLQKGREYETQKSLMLDGKRYQPDVIIHLPQGKDLIIDAKVSLTAYERFRNAQDETERAAFFKEHISSLRNHMRQLADKAYHDLEGLNTIDLVLMFVPVEPAYLEAMNAEPALMEEAFNKKILMLSTSNLLATLRTVATLWQNEKRNENALEIARQAGALYDKFVGFCTDLDDVKKKLDDADRAWHKAENKLKSGRGNLVYSTEKLKKLGARAKKQQDNRWLEGQQPLITSDESPDQAMEGRGDALPSKTANKAPE